MLLSKMCIAAVTGHASNGSGWLTSSLTMPPVVIGANADLLGAPPHVGPGDRWFPSGPDVLKLLKQHEKVVLQHPPHPALVADLQSAGCEVYLWFDFEAVPAAGYWSPVMDTMERVLMNWRLLGTGPNRFGEPYVDPYEGAVTPKGTKPHAYSVNVTGEGFVDLYVETLMKVLEQYPPGVRVFLDNAMDQEFFGIPPGGATNAPDRNDPKRILKWREAWQSLLWKLGRLGVLTYGNCGAEVTEYPHLDGKMDEHIFRTHQSPRYAAAAAVQSIVSGAKERGAPQDFAFHVDPDKARDAWANDPVRWEQLHRDLVAAEVEALVVPSVVTMRSGQRLFHPGPAVATVTP